MLYFGNVKIYEYESCEILIVVWYCESYLEMLNNYGCIVG